MAFTYAGLWSQQFIYGSGTLAGKPLAVAAFTVYSDAGLTTPATLYTDRTKSVVQANPGKVTDAYGNGYFYADPGIYWVSCNGVTVAVEVAADPSEPETDFANPLLLPGNLVLPKTTGIGVKRDIVAPTFGWCDLLGAVDPKTTGANTPTLAAWRGGNVREFAFAANDLLDMTFHMPHDWVPGTDLFIHVHWAHHGTAISGNFVMDFYTTFARGFNQASNGNFGAEVNTTLSVSTPNIATIPQYRHRTDEVQLSSSTPTANQIDTAKLEVDTILALQAKMTTIPTITGGATNKPFIFTIDIHYQSLDGAAATKAKAPDFYT